MTCWRRLAQRIPVVVLSGPPRGDDYDHVTVSNAEAMTELTRLVLAQADQGRIAFLARPGGFAGRRTALGRASPRPSPRPVIALDDVTVVRGDFTRASGREAAESLIAAGPPSALVAANDQMALGALDAFRSAGLRVPDDVLVTGFDGIEAAALSTPAADDGAAADDRPRPRGRAAARAVVSSDRMPIRSRSDCRSRSCSGRARSDPAEHRFGTVPMPVTDWECAVWARVKGLQIQKCMRLQSLMRHRAAGCPDRVAIPS